MMVKLSLCATIAALAHAVMANDAPERQENPTDVVILGLFNISQRPLQGGIAIYSDDGTAKASVRLFGLPSKGSPYSYSINTNPLSRRGACSEAGGVLNPYGGKKNAPTWGQLMIGDLSGKHGKAEISNYQCEYEDPYLSIQSNIPRSGLQDPSYIEDPSYIGNRTLVVTDKDGFDFACCNLVASSRLGKMVDMNGAKVPEEFYSMLMEMKKTN